MKDCKLLEYKGYLGSIEASIEDKCFCGSVQFVRDLISYSGNSFQELEQSFHNALDEYLDFCNEIRQEPSITCSGTFNVRIGNELHKQAAIAAKKNGKNLNEFVRDAIQDKIDGKTNVESHIYIHNDPVVDKREVSFPFEKQRYAWSTGRSRTSRSVRRHSH